MDGFERHRMLSALIAVVMVLFVSGGVAPLRRWARPLRFMAIAIFCGVSAWALVEIAVWLAEIDH
jgi:hypothetical protein